MYFRLAYLCDAFSFSSPLGDPSQLITHLRKVGSSSNSRKRGHPDINFIQTVLEFMDVIHVYEARSDQSFFVNTRLLRSLRLNEPESLRSFIFTFIDIADSPTVVSRILSVPDSHVQGMSLS